MEVGLALSSLENKYAVRQEMVDRLMSDLFGPDSVDEVLSERPLERYVTGVLWPSSTDTTSEAADDPESAATEAGEDAGDSPVANALQNFPSSFGLTISVDLGRSTAITVIPRAAKYVSESSERNETGNISPSLDWRRGEMDSSPQEVDMTVAGHQRILLEDGALELYILVRKAEKNIATATVVLRNRQTKPGGGEDRDVACWFQCSLEIQTENFALTDRSKLRTSIPSDRDLATAELLYRNHMVFGIGHGCAVTVSDSDVQGPRSRKISTTFIPTKDVHRAKPGTTKADLRLGTLGNASAPMVLKELRTLTTEYEQWIVATDQNCDKSGESFVSPHLRPVADRHMDEARRALERIVAGIELLEEDEQAFEAFQLANRAMHMQRSRQDWVRDNSTSEFTLGKSQAWRPFQLAFILLNLASLTDRQHEERDIADLLWFPTGGGKTEAYLGLVSYLIMLRRLRDSSAQGVAVIMRYTLRLLTIQQFERASMLICSLEAVRKQDPSRLGIKPFSIGLWVGGAAVPNTLREATAALNKLAKGEEVTEGNPCQIKACPWCGKRLTLENYQVIPKQRMRVFCSNKTCEFADGLPVHLVDTDIYREEPELIIGTVDKFAQMAWRGEVAQLFGRADSTSYGPDLIIQDELHLISGPLGSTVGLFETAVDLAVGGDFRVQGSPGYRPKIIASTATIRRASDQIRAVFDRESHLFPPPVSLPTSRFLPSRQGPMSWVPASTSESWPRGPAMPPSWFAHMHRYCNPVRQSRSIRFRTETRTGR